MGGCCSKGGRDGSQSYMIANHSDRQEVRVEELEDRCDDQASEVKRLEVRLREVEERLAAATKPTATATTIAQEATQEKRLATKPTTPTPTTTGKEAKRVSEDSRKLAIIAAVGTGTEIMSLKHGAAVYRCCFSPNGRRVASVSRDKLAWVWDVRKGKVTMEMKGHRGMVLGCAISPDGNTLCTSSDDKTCRTWDLNTGQAIRTFKGHSDKVYSCAFSPDGLRIATASCDRDARVWDLNGKMVAKLSGHTSVVFCVNFAHSDPDLVLSASDDGTLRSWSWRLPLSLTEFSGHNATVWSGCFSPDDSQVLSASMDKTVKLWSRDGVCVRTFEGHTHPVHQAEFAQGGEWIVSASRDRTVKIWNTETGTTLMNCVGHNGTVFSVSVFGNLIASCSNDKSLKLWDTTRRPAPCSDGEPAV